MSVLILLIAAGGLVAGGFLAAFAWAVCAGQFDDTATPPLRMLMDEPDPLPSRPAPLRPGAVPGGSSAGGETPADSTRR
jgi:cbb3-type cytochrome oxidase maturation protein